MSAISLVAEEICFNKFFQKLCMYQDRSVSESNISASDKSASFAELMYGFMRLVKLSISCLAIFCKVSLRDC